MSVQYTCKNLPSFSSHLKSRLICRSTCSLEGNRVHIRGSFSRQFVIVCVILAVMKPAAFGWKPQAAYIPQEDVPQFAASQNKFARNLYMKLVEKNSGNLFFSPLSIMTALGMAYSGAAGKTEQEMRSVMHLAQDKEAVHNAFQDIVTDLKTEVTEYELHTSNMAYVSNRLNVLTDYVNTLREKYLSSLKTVNFEEADQVCKEINTEVEKETNSHIKNLIPSGTLNAMTRMILVNAVYFKGLWEHQFKKSATFDQEFWTSAWSHKRVPMMHITNDFRMFHHRDLGATVLTMDYKGSRLSMVFVLPDKCDGLAEVEAKLAEVDLNEIDKKVLCDKVQVTIPKFKLQETLDVVAYLKGMGIEDLFDETTCDLSGISGTKELCISNVIHKAFLDVHEEGSEAAAATVAMMVFGCSASYVHPPQFIADHPFFFYIRDHQTELVLFVGRLVSPQ